MSDPRQRKGSVHEPLPKQTGCPFPEGQHFFAFDGEDSVALLLNRAHALSRRAMRREVTLRCVAARKSPR